MYLLDTNIILELLLDQKKADEVEKLLRTSVPGTLYFSEFSFYSLGVILFRLKKYEIFLRAEKDLFDRGGVQLIRLRQEQMQQIVKAAENFKLDFDDAYQYCIAEENNLTIVSFDKDFDKTKRGRKIPSDIME